MVIHAFGDEHTLGWKYCDSAVFSKYKQTLMAKSATPPGAGLVPGSHFQNFWIFPRPPGFFELNAAGPA